MCERKKYAAGSRGPLLLVLAFLLFVIISSVASAQVSDDYILKLNPVYVKEYNEKPDNSTRLKMDFGSPVILNPSDALAINGKAILRVDLVYTAFQLSDKFQQPKLNKERLAALRRQLPSVFKSTAVEWRVIAQDGCRNEYEAKKMFHGFVITWRPDPSMTEMQKEISSMVKATDNDSLGKDSFVVITKMRFKRRSELLGYYPILNSKRKAGVLYSSRGVWHRKPKYHVWYDTLIRKDSVPQFVVSKNAMKYLSRTYSSLDWGTNVSPDTTIMAVLNRNKQWKNILFVCDVTGSMSPYSAQLLIWHKLNFNTRRAKFFTFFNDGDDKPDRKKKIGQTGGIYHTQAASVADVEEMARRAMSRGCGGDAPENDVEALIAAIDKCPDADEIVLIADNWAPLKDAELIPKIKKPVHVIVCGVYGGAVNADYIELALRTKGSVHTMEEDITNLVKLNEGQKFKIGRQTYQLKNGKFVLVYDL